MASRADSRWRSFPLAAGVMLIDAWGVLLDQPSQAQFAFPVLSGITRTRREAKRRERVRSFQELQQDLGYLAKDLSEVNVADPDNIRIVAKVENRAVELILGDGNFARAVSEFCDALSGDPEAIAGNRSRSICGWTIASPQRLKD